MKDVIKYIISLVSARAHSMSEAFCDLVANNKPVAVIIIQLGIYIICGYVIWLIARKQKEKRKSQPNELD